MIIHRYQSLCSSFSQLLKMRNLGLLVLKKNALTFLSVRALSWKQTGQPTATILSCASATA